MSLLEINRITDEYSLNLQRGKLQEKQAVSFQALLQRESRKEQGVQFSKHASQRVQERGILLNDETLKNLNTAVEKVRQKGARDAVIIGEKGAFIVNVPHNIVVTTMTENEMKDNIFTNIDSAVFM